MLIARGRPSLIRWWLGVGIIVLAALFIAGIRADWRETWLVVVGIVIATYLAVPPMVLALLDLADVPRRTKHMHSRREQRAPTGGTLAWDVALNPVVEELAAAFGNVDDVEDLATSSGLPLQQVRKSRRADMYWHQVLLRANEEGETRVDAVLDLALARSKRTALADVIQQYRDTRTASS